MASQFFLPADINSLFAKNKKVTSFFHLNAQSLRSKEDEIIAFLGLFDFEFDIIFFTETWYRTDHEALIMPHYNSYVLNRPNKKGGGVMIAAKESVRCSVLPDFTKSCEDFEILSLKAGQNIFSVLYRPPCGSIPNFLSFLDTFLTWITENRFYLVLGGDINIDFSTPSTQQRQINNLLDCNGFINAIIDPTRLSTSTATSIDAFITNLHDKSIVSGVISGQVSDHLPIFYFIDSRITKSNKTTPQQRQLVNKDTLTRFRSRLEQIDWSPVYEVTDPDKAYDIFISIIKPVYIECFPYRSTRKPQSARKPWINKECLKMIKHKNYLYNCFIKNRSTDDFLIFKAYRNKVTSFLRQAKKEYFHNLFNKDVLKRSDKVWKQLNTIINPSKSINELEVMIDDETLSGKKLADSFNDFFVSVAHTIHDPTCMRYLGQSNSFTAFLAPTDQNEIMRCFNSLKNSKSKDVDGFQILPFKHAIDVLCPILDHVFNCCFAQGTFPSRMQTARVIVIHKGGDTNNLSNYRPISILPLFSKCLEKLLHSRILGFCEKHKLITPSQHGFRKLHSTETALLTQKELILESFEHKELTLGIFIDFSKAFDRVNHETLLLKLDRYGFRGCFYSIIKSYLEARFQQVVIDNTLSDPKHIAAGVPQGSILGPLLFNLYINDIVNIDPNTTFVIYADDTSLFFRAPCVSSLEVNATRCLRSLHHWSLSNSLNINISKTKAVLFRPRNKSVSELTLSIGSSKIHVSSSVKSLGVTFHENLSWDVHVDNTVAKISRVVGILSKFRYYFPQCIKKLLYDSLFTSVITYCFLVWGTTTVSNITKLHALQKKAVRAINNIPNDVHTKPVFEALHIVPIVQLYSVMLRKKYTSNINQGTAFLADLSRLTCRERPYNTRIGDNWYLPRTRTNYGRQMLSYNIPSILNNL